jgi:hypothetical protein
MENNMYTPCPCFSCGKQISYCGKSLTNVNDAIEIDLDANYGSRFDLSIMTIWICDDCIEQNMEERVFVVVEDVTYNYEMEKENE